MAELSTFTPTGAPMVERIEQKPQSNVYTALTGIAAFAAALGVLVVYLKAQAVLNGLF